MNKYTLTRLRDDVLLCSLNDLAAQDRTITANLLAYMAEVDLRRLFAPAGYSSMHAYCVEKLGLSDDAAFKRLQVARQARRFPQVYVALAEGRVHLSGLNLLAPHLTAENVDELLAAARHRRKSEIELLVARRFPRVEVQRLDDGICALSRLAPAQVGGGAADAAPALGDVSQAPADAAPAPAQVGGLVAPAKVVAEPRPRVAPITAERFAVQVTIDRATHDKLRHAQALLGHTVPSGDVFQVLDRALDALIDQLEKRKLGAASKPREPRPSLGKRTIPAHVRRAVWKRDGGWCTFVGDDGHRCDTRTLLEFDHVVPVALGGDATAEQIRLLCRTHNQHEAERLFGKHFMEGKRARDRSNGETHVSDRPPGTRIGAALAPG